VGIFSSTRPTKWGIVSCSQWKGQTCWWEEAVWAYIQTTKEAAVSASTPRTPQLTLSSMSASAVAQWSSFTLNAWRVGLEARLLDSKLPTVFTIAMSPCSAKYANTQSATKWSTMEESTVYTSTSKSTRPLPNSSIMQRTRSSRFSFGWSRLWK